VQNLSVVMIALLAAAAAVAITVAVLDRRGRRATVQIALGLALGLVGAFVILVSRVDLIPDEPEELLQRLFVVGLTAVAVVGTWYRIARA
jgi:predicted membrane channel-forming protein YqfA (hemolysin III family)